MEEKEAGSLCFPLNLAEKEGREEAEAVNSCLPVWSAEMLSATPWMDGS